MPRQPLPRNAKSADARLIYSLIKTGSYVDLDEFKRQLPRSASSVDEKKKQKTKGGTDKKPRRPYSTMIMAALRSLQTASAGTGFQSIAKYVNANFDVPENYKGYVKAALRRMVHKGRLQKIKGMYRSKKIRVPKAAAPTNHKVPKRKPVALPKKPISAPSVTISRPRSTSTSCSVSLPLKKSEAPTISPVQETQSRPRKTHTNLLLLGGLPLSLAVLGTPDRMA